MTEVLFYSGPADRAMMACRLLRKIVRNGMGVTVCVPPDRIEAFDRLLWTFEPTEFVPHAVIPAGPRVVDAVLQLTPIWLVADADGNTPHRVLLNLGDEPCPGFATYERLIEIVSDDLASKAAGRSRWKHYQSRGYAIVHHALPA